MADMDTFIVLSAALTGISAEKLSPPVDPINVKQAYFNQAQSADGGAFATALGIVQANNPTTVPPMPPKLGPDDLADLLLNKSGDDVRYLCRAVMLMWFLGSWYAPADLKLYSGQKPPSAPIKSTVISSAAYTQGWVWNVAQAHPMGYSNLRFGYWNAAPPLLSDFIS
jgi:hypothetical protein